MNEEKNVLIISLRGEIRIGKKPDGLDPLEVWIPLPSERVREKLEDPEVQELVRALPETVLVGRSGRVWEVEFTPRTHQTLGALWKKLKGGEG